MCKLLESDLNLILSNLVWTLAITECKKRLEKIKAYSWLKKDCKYIGLIFKVYLLHFGPVSSGRLPDLPGPKLSNKKKDIAWSFSHQESALNEQK